MPSAGYAWANKLTIAKAAESSEEVVKRLEDGHEHEMVMTVRLLAWYPWIPEGSLPWNTVAVALKISQNSLCYSSRPRLWQRHAKLGGLNRQLESAHRVEAHLAGV